MVPLLFIDHLDESEEWHALSTSPANKVQYAPMYCVSNFYSLCKLSVIMNKILNKIYREKSEVQHPDAITKNLGVLKDDLQSWQRTLPAHLTVSPSSIGQGTTPLPSPHVYVVL